MSADKAVADAPKSGKKKLVLIAMLCLLLGGGGAGAAVWFLMPRPDAAETQADAASAKKKKKDKKKAEKPLFSALDPFTVNLRDERGERFAQIGITLEIEEPAIDAKIKDHLPTLRNNILLLIASKRIEEILTDDGKRQLATQIQGRIGEALGADKDDNPIKGVLFSQFLVQ